MILFPAIDIRKGKCVRLLEGRFDQETVYGEDPVAMARRWQEEGAEYLHVVDLDGALAGMPQNLAIIREICAQVDMPVQMGGGIRTLETIDEVFSAGVQRVILGSIAVRQPELVREACRRYGDRIVVGIDAREGMVAVEGWGISGDVKAEDLACRMKEAGVRRIVFTDISRDGTLQGVNVEATRMLAKAAGISVIASGGVRDVNDILALKEVAADGVEGVIIGRAIYTGSVNLREALQIARGGE